MSASPALFGITKWFTWATRLIQTEARQAMEAKSQRAGVEPCPVCQALALLRLQHDEHNVDGAADVSGRVT
jgi:hypothetical protein